MGGFFSRMFVKPDPRNYGRAPEFCAPEEIGPDIPLKLKAGVAPVLLSKPEFKEFDVADLIDWARKATKNRVPVPDRATAIALLLK